MSANMVFFMVTIGLFVVSMVITSMMEGGITGDSFKVGLILFIFAIFLIMVGAGIGGRYDRVSVGETYEVMVRIGDNIVVADKEGKRMRFATPQQVFIDNKGVIHIVYPADILTSKDILTDKEGRMIRGKKE